MTATLLFAVSACGGSGDNRDTRQTPLKVVTTVAPITSLTENIGGTKIELVGIAPESANSHAFEPPSSVYPSIADADLVILNGLGLDDRVQELAEANTRKDAVILLLGDSTITPAEYKYDFSFPQSGGKPNPHLWPDPVLASRYAALIHEQLVSLDSQNKAYYDANFTELSRRLELLDQQTRVAVQTIPQADRKLLTYHDSWAYWAERYGVTVVGAIQSSDFAEPSASEINSLIDQVKTEKIPAIFGSDLFTSALLKQIADETGAEYVGDLSDDNLPDEPGDPYHSYVGMMVQDMQIMIPALGGDAAPMARVQPGLVFGDGPSPAKYAE